MELNDNNYEELTKCGNWLICFFYSWCKPCHKLKNVLLDLYKNDKIINVGFVNLDECPQILKKKNIYLVPTLYILSQAKLKDKIVGLISSKKLKTLINKKFNFTLKTNIKNK